MNDDHDPTTCFDILCETCKEYSMRESIVRLETALLDLETSPEGAEGEWLDMTVLVDALDIRNVLDLLREA